MSILQSTQFDIKKLAIVSKDGTQGFDVRSIFEELNLFDSMLMPCMSGSIVIRDAIGFASSINFDGSEYIEIDITKDADSPDYMFFRKRYVIYKLTDRKELNQTSEIYTLHFVSEEFILSEQKKIRQSYKGTYYEMVVKILNDHLHVPFETIIDGSRAGIANMEPSKGLQVYSVPNVSPMKAIEYITKRAVSSSGTPDYLFWENQIGYNFMSLSTSMEFDAFGKISYGVKNISALSGGEEINKEIYGAREIKVLSQFNMAKNIQDGVYAGKFIGFDPITRTVTTQNYSFGDVYDLGSHANEEPFNSALLNKETKFATEMYDSRVSLYPFQESRTVSPYLREKDSKTTNIIDDSHNYVLQRQIIFSNLMQRRLRIVLPGNFSIASGNNYEVEIPHRHNIKEGEGIDKTLSGKYIVLGVRHIIRYDKHETIIEVATDSMKKI